MEGGHASCPAAREGEGLQAPLLPLLNYSSAGLGLTHTREEREIDMSQQESSGLRVTGSL
jgi:hypothetical protein